VPLEPRGRRLLRLEGPDGTRVGVVEPAAPTTVVELTGADLAALFARHVETVREGSAQARVLCEALDEETLELPEPYRLLAPIDAPEVWGAGVTYERSRAARVAETQVEDVYSLVYEAERPEVFLKDAGMRRTVGPGGTVGVRAGSTWTVPEPELALVLGGDGSPVGVTIGNDLTARDIEARNPLYLAQAKLFAGGCAIGPAILVPDDWRRPFEIRCRILREDGSELWAGATSTEQMRRSFDELVAYVVRENPVPPGSVLLTGTGLVPPDEVALAPGHVCEVEVSGIGTLRNPVGAAADLLPRRT
jgi:2-dehydro-3-deoxy-D-arabinonate dehydratase